MEVDTDWKSMRILIFMDLKRLLKWLKNKKRSKKTFKTVIPFLKFNGCKFLTRNVLYGLLLGVSAIERSVLGS